MFVLIYSIINTFRSRTTNANSGIVGEISDIDEILENLEAIGSAVTGKFVQLHVPSGRASVTSQKSTDKVTDCASQNENLLLIRK